MRRRNDAIRALKKELDDANVLIKTFQEKGENSMRHLVAKSVGQTSWLKVHCSGMIESQDFPNVRLVSKFIILA